MVPNLQSGGRGTAKGYSNRGVKAQQGQADEPSLRRRWIGSGSGYQDAGGPAGRGKRGGRAQGLWKVVKFQLHDFHALPEYLRDNEFIHRHYRVHWPLKESALSIFSIHNETLNIWTWVPPPPRIIIVNPGVHNSSPLLEFQLLGAVSESLQLMLLLLNLMNCGFVGE